MFYEIGNKMINLKRVSNIIFDKKKLKVDFQFANSINILGKETSDFHEVRFTRIDDIIKLKMKLLSDFKVDKMFIRPPVSVLGNEEWVNKNHINSIALDEDNAKIIFNLDYSIEVVDKRTGDLVKISKFIYWRFESKEKAQEEYYKIKRFLKPIN